MEKIEGRRSVILCDGDPLKAVKQCGQRQNADIVCACAIVAGEKFTSTSEYLASLLRSQEKLSAEIKKLEREMTKHDQLTGALAITFFISHVRELITLKETDIPAVLVIIDIDNLKQVNDMHGHPAGNSILSCFGDCVRKNIREEDPFGRLGGDEFGILFRGATVEVIQEVVECIRSQYEKIEFDFNVSRSDEIHPSFSYGAAVYGLDGTTYEELFAQADARMYIEKRARKLRRGDGAGLQKEHVRK